MPRQLITKNMCGVAIVRKWLRVVTARCIKGKARSKGKGKENTKDKDKERNRMDKGKDEEEAAKMHTREI